MTDAQDTSGRVGLVGKTLGRYKVSAELGRGGMATVYRAFDPQLARDVAVKVIHGAFTGRGDIERRFRREAQAVAGLKHEGIVAVFDFAPGGDGEPAYIVSELVEGPTLKQLLERCGGRLLPEIAVLVAARLAAALGAAHAHGIVHRDVKPDNVMIDLGGPKGGGAGGGRPPRVLLTDFGIARMIEDETLTATGSILGSPAYMSPEQAKGGDVAASSDVFALGVLAYQLATGRVPFGGKDPLSVIAAIAGGEFLRPSKIDARVAPDLEAVILRCLQRAPGERFADGRAVEAALRAVAARGPLGDETAALRRFFDDGERERLQREVAAAVAEEAVASGRACVKRNELARALGHINRALAYVPGHAGAEALLATVSSRRRWLKLAAGTGAAAALALAGVVAARGGLTAAPPALPPPPPVKAVMAGPASPAPAPAIAIATAPEPPPVPTPTVPATVAAAERPAETTRRRPPARERKTTAPSRAPATRTAAAPTAGATTAAESTPGEPAAAATPAIAGAAAPPALTPPSGPAPSPGLAGPPAAPAAATGGLTLRASYGFCSPSLDEHAAAVRPIYNAVPAGPHRIYCTLPGGARTLVGTYELKAGTHPSLVIVPGADGKPALGRAQ